MRANPFVFSRGRTFMWHLFLFCFMGCILVCQPSYAQTTERTISGVVRDDTGESLPGASVVLLEGGKVDPRYVTHTDVDGNFTLKVPATSKKVRISFMGYEDKLVTLGSETTYDIRMLPLSNDLNEVVVTGAFTRKANTFTGAVTTVKGEDLTRVGNQNVLQSLSMIDPSFIQIENLSAGSNPNGMPDFQMRGSSTISTTDVQSQYASNANQPLFILDGFETTLTRVMDLDMNQVASVTTLKDATAKAIYGSKGANGVVVIETKRPQAGTLRVTYTGNLNLEVPDLSSYDLCNAAEKLEVERMAGLFSSDNALTQISLDQTYSNKLHEVLAGVNTDWLAQPVRTGVGQKHSLYVEGGDKAMTYGVNLAFNNIEGAMKGSSRNTFNGGITLAYRVKDLIFRNQLTIDYNSSDESPYGNFSDYAKMNPYSRLRDENGNLIQSYVYTNNAGETGQYYNPLYNTTLNTIDNTSYTNITNNFYLEWQIMPRLRFTGRFGLVHQTNTADQFKPANHTDFINETDEFAKGSYYKLNGVSTNINADANISYSLELAKHAVFLNGQLSMSDVSYESAAMLAEGFPNDKMNDITFAVQYAKNQSPTGEENVSRSCGGLLSLNYSFDNRYLFDANYRLTGSSETGAHNRWGSFWSVGGGWNIHNEAFLRGNDYVNRLKLRASFGYTGSQGFSSYNAITTFRYYSNDSYNGYIGSYAYALANPDLRWQETYDTNVGLDFDLFKNRLSGRVDYYISDTQGMITQVTVPGTTGFSTYVANLGETENRGVEAYLNYRVYEDRKKGNYVNVYVNMAHNKNRLKKISNSLRAWNDEQDQNMLENKVTTPSVKYFEGCSMTAIWAVPSQGIDPQTGKEIFVKRDGSITYDYDVSDQVVCGDTQPKVNGNFGFNGEINGIGFSATCGFRVGGQIYNTTLVDKVENAALQYNVDRRVFTDRWQKPGDVALYKSISDQSVTYPTSRFVEDYNTFTLSSLSVYYDFKNCRFMRNNKLLERLKITAYTNDLFVFSSVRTERGTDYPYARTFSLSVQATF